MASRHDEGRYCKLLYGYLEELGADITRQVGSSAEKALAVEGQADKLAFRNRGQGWVAPEVARRCRACPMRTCAKAAGDGRHAPCQHRHLREADRRAALRRAPGAPAAIDATGAATTPPPVPVRSGHDR